MKKLLTLIIAAGLLTGCGSDETKEKQTAEPAKEAPVKETAAEKTVYFKDGIAKLEDLRIEITDTKVIPVGEKGNEYGENPVFAIWYDTTNFTDDDIDPMTAWIVVFTAIQDNDPNMVNELDIASLPDEAHLDTQMNTIKKDGTVANSVAYELDDLETPVTLVANQGALGGKLGEEEFEIK